MTKLVKFAIKNSCDAHIAHKIEFSIGIQHYAYADDRKYSMLSCYNIAHNQPSLYASVQNIDAAEKGKIIHTELDECDVETIFVMLKFDECEYEFRFAKYQLILAEEDPTIIFEVFSGEKLPYVRMNGQKCNSIEGKKCGWQDRLDTQNRIEKKLKEKTAQMPQEQECNCCACLPFRNYIVGFFDRIYSCVSTNAPYAPVNN